MAETLLKVQHITKRFPGVLALDDVSMEFEKGEVHAICGENGAGKSTLIKILTGAYTPTSGTIEWEGKTYESFTPKQAMDLGITTIYQEFNLVPFLSVAENVFFGRELQNGIFLNKAEMQRRTVDLAREMDIDVDPKARIKDLGVAYSQITEILKAISHDTKILIMDEPSAPLSNREIEAMFGIIRKLKAKGVTIVYISHRMDEIFEICDRVTVMRDGQYVNTVDTAETTIDQVVQMMVGRVIYEEPKTQSNVPEGAPIVFEAEELVSKDVKGVSFNLKKGEILGFAGLMGAGRTETARLICGADPRHGGTIRINGKEVRINSPRDAVAAGIGYLSEDRKRYGLCLGLSVADNTVLASLDQFSKVAFVDDRKIEGVSHEYVKKVRTKTPSVKSKVRSLSGGNQQKVVLSKWLLNNCDILIFDEPTRGIDVGAKSEIYKLMHQLADDGKSIIMISSEMPELLRMSDRIVVMCEGRKTGELDIAEATQEKIMTLATKREVG